MGCRWGVLSFKLKFNRTPRCWTSTSTSTYTFMGTPPRSQLLSSARDRASLCVRIQYSCATLTTRIMRAFRPPRARNAAPGSGPAREARKGVYPAYKAYTYRHFSRWSARRPAPASRARPPPTDRVRALERDSTATAWRPTYFRQKKAKKREQPLLRLPRWSPTLVLTELDDA